MRYTARVRWFLSRVLGWFRGQSPAQALDHVTAEPPVPALSDFSTFLITHVQCDLESPGVLVSHTDLDSPPNVGSSVWICRQCNVMAIGPVSIEARDPVAAERSRRVYEAGECLRQAFRDGVLTPEAVTFAMSQLQ